jgi:hypothetical protein
MTIQLHINRVGKLSQMWPNQNLDKNYNLEFPEIFKDFDKNIEKMIKTLWIRKKFHNQVDKWIKKFSFLFKME